MKRKLFLVLATCSLGLAPLGYADTSRPIEVVNLDQMREAKALSELPAPLRSFLKSDAGSKYKASDFVKFLRNEPTSTIQKAPAIENADFTPEEIVVLSEDFSKWTAGSEGNPDATDIAADSTTMQTYMQTPGWNGFLAYQAGGVAYLGLDEVGDDGPGTLLTPELNLAATGGAYKLKFRARSANPMQETQALQTWTLDNATGSIINARGYDITSEWTECEMDFTGGGNRSMILLHGMQGMVYFDDFEVIAYDYGIGKPVVEDMALLSLDQITARWTKVENATSYHVALYDVDNGVYALPEYDLQSADTTCVIDFPIVAGTYYRLEVKATDGEHLSPAGTLFGYLTPDAVGTPEALPATDVTDESFTANWNAAPFAYGYEVNVTKHHIAQADGEVLVLTDENFDLMPGGTEEGPQTLVQLNYMDKYMQQPGWMVDLGLTGFTSDDSGILGITNMMADWGIPGFLLSPTFDLSNGGGKVKVEFKAKSFLDDAVLVLSLVNYEEGVPFPGYVGVSVGTEWQEFSYELEGGVNGCEIYIMVYDATEGGDVIYLDDLKVTQTLNKDEYIRFPYRKAKTDEPNVLQAVIETPGKTAGSFFSYNVNGYFPVTIDPVYGDEIMYSEASEEVYVDAPDAVKAIDADKVAKAYVAGDELRIENPAGEPVYIYTVGGALIKADVTGSAVVTSRLTQKGVYIVRVGNQAAKVVR